MDGFAVGLVLSGFPSIQCNKTFSQNSMLPYKELLSIKR